MVNKKVVFGLVTQIIQLALAGAILLVGVVEFSVEPPIFDVLGNKGERPSIPPDVFENVTSNSIGAQSLGRVMDIPVVILFIVYFLSVVWMKCRGLWAWSMTVTMMISILMVVAVNAGLAKDVLDWKFFRSRSVTILLDVLIIALAWTVIVVILLHVRNWFPFKIKKTPVVGRWERLALFVWNFIALYVVLTLCLLLWFSRLYMSWACVRNTDEILLLCQFTNQIQCYQCVFTQDKCDTTDLQRCVSSEKYEPFHCLSPLYTITEPRTAFCVFNYNIGPITFLSVFSFVGGLYFFLRTTLNALVKCIRVTVFLAYKSAYRLMASSKAKKNDEEKLILEVAEGNHINTDLEEKNELPIPVPAKGVSPDPRVSLLASLPAHYYSTNNKTTSKQ